jgi:hypothetical protein
MHKTPLRLFLAGVLLAITSNCMADLGSNTYSIAQQAYARHQWYLAWGGFVQYLNEDRAFLDKNPKVEAEVLRAIDYCATKVSSGGVPTRSPPIAAIRKSMYVAGAENPYSNSASEQAAKQAQQAVHQNADQH